ncbi:MAG: prepilin peptidase [Candidatus Shapirobacteria bacterium]|nr:prepilin peptidase [Candidatus Shapirobacteria bacterium]MDD5073787.1 prepilin peptidase [Candidatus Shapirobacteria bacterium]MDD5481528.1 prepilin peptidase [Candidatus Shapirobacteria bacterium]
MGVNLIIVFVIGLFIGSFLNVVIDRIARDEKFFSGRSYCESCQHPLFWLDLVPLFSFILLAGRCRYCKSRIPFWLPLVEVITGLVFALIIFFSWGLSWWLVIFRLVIASFLVVIFFADLKYRLVYGIVVYPALIVTLAYQTFLLGGGQGLINPLLSSVFTGLFFYGLYLLTKKKGLGFGDVQIGFLLGLLLGYPATVVSLYLSFLTGALVGIILMVAGRAKLKTPVAFGPFLVFSAFAAWFFGQEMFNFVKEWLFF